MTPLQLVGGDSHPAAVHVGALESQGQDGASPGAKGEAIHSLIGSFRKRSPTGQEGLVTNAISSCLEPDPRTVNSSLGKALRHPLSRRSLSTAPARPCSALPGDTHQAVGVQTEAQHALQSLTRKP